MVYLPKWLQAFVDRKRGHSQLEPPKRLFNIKTMKTVMYEDVKHKVRRKGYVCISHVWGDQQKYTSESLGIKGGVDWLIPLSDPTKLHKMVAAMECVEKEYCWWDVLCMPQDKQDEIDKEIPYMGDYYSGAKVTLVLSTDEYVISSDLMTWYTMMVDVVEFQRDFTDKEHMWLRSHEGCNLLDVSADPWYTRVWTLQEATLSKKISLVTGENVLEISDILKGMVYMSIKNSLYLSLFIESGEQLLNLGLCMHFHENQMNDLATVLQNSVNRKCYRLEDKFYGALGILGYKDFVVDYNVDIDDLNRKMAQHAYFKGDISWLSVGGNYGKGFVQPMYKPFHTVGTLWKEDSLGSCGISFDGDAIWLDTRSFAKITGIENPPSPIEDDCSELDARLRAGKRVVFAFKELGFSDLEIADVTMEFSNVPRIVHEMVTAYLDRQVRGEFDDMGALFDAKDLHDPIIRRAFDKIVTAYEATTIVKATSNNTHIPLIIYGDANVGDEVMSMKLHDDEGRTIGIVYDGSRRKGICVCRAPNGDSSAYTPHKFL